MKRKKLSKKEKALIKKGERRESKIKEVRDDFYPDGVFAKFEFPAVHSDSLEDIYLEEKELVDYMGKDDTQVIIQENKFVHVCIRQDIRESGSNNIEICFDKGEIRFDDSIYTFSDIMVVIEFTFDSEPIYFFLGEDEHYDARILVSSKPKEAVFFFRDKGAEEDDKKVDMYHCIFYFSLFCYCKDAKQEEEEKIIVVNWYGPALDLFCDVLTKGTYIQDWHFWDFIQMLNMEDLIAEWKEAKSKMEQEQKKISEEDKNHIPEDKCQDKKQHKREPTEMMAQQSKQDCCVQGKDAAGKK